ncbi:MAG: winged helix-turn-helix domain-containing protein, partial [Armatimonadetes bacterium]|nr:winged helix-turn-helix domain-containing protein [Armatimonadota bacterium]
MTRTATKKTKKASDSPATSPAVQYLEDLIYDLMLNTGQAAKSREIAGELEETVKLHPKFIRKILYYSDRFDMEDRRWNLALRTAIQLPFEGAIEYALRCHGKPMSLRAIHNEMALVQRRPVEFFDTLLLDTLKSRPKYWETPDGLWCLREWLLDTSQEDPDKCFLQNFFLDAAQVRPVVDDMLTTRMSSDQAPIEMAIKLIRHAGEPVPSKLLTYVIWRLREGDLDPVALFQECQHDERIVPASGLSWGLTEFVPDYDKELKRLARRAEKEHDAEWAEEEEPEGPIVLTPADLEEVFKYLRRRKKPQPASVLAEAIFEYGPGSRRAQEAVDTLMSGIALDSRFVRVGSQTWALPQMKPKQTDTVPPAL